MSYEEGTVVVDPCVVGVWWVRGVQCVWPRGERLVWKGNRASKALSTRREATPSRRSWRDSSWASAVQRHIWGWWFDHECSVFAEALCLNHGSKL